MRSMSRALIQAPKREPLEHYSTPSFAQHRPGEHRFPAGRIASHVFSVVCRNTLYAFGQQITGCRTAHVT
jgi:hypothetical protein